MLTFLVLIKNTWESGESIEWWYNSGWIDKNYGHFVYRCDDEQLHFLVLKIHDNFNEPHLNLVLDQFCEKYFCYIRQGAVRTNKEEAKFLSEYFNMKIYEI